MTVSPTVDFIVVNGPIYTSDPLCEWAEAMAVGNGRVTAVGETAAIRAMAGPDAAVVDLQGRLAMPGLVDVHAHLGLGGRQAAYELPLLPTDSTGEIFAKIRQWAENLAPDEWVIGGIVGSTVMDDITLEDLRQLDEAAGGRPVLLRDDSMHNRWVNTRALELMGVTASTPDPEGGTYSRDDDGALTGVLQELASPVGEEAAAASTQESGERHATAFRTAVQILNSFGVTAVQEAATMGYALETLADLDRRGELTAHVVASMPSRPFIEPGITGPELYDIGELHRTEHVHPDFSKYVLDGVPMTRTSAMLSPYLCSHGSHDPDHTAEPLWELGELTASLEALVDRGLHAKLHATGDAAVRLVLDAVEQVRASRGEAPIFQIAHVEYIAPADVPRFTGLDVVPDASPYIWFPSVIQESIAKQIPAETFDKSWPLKDLFLDGALVSGGSDWPCSAPSPDPWTGLETMITRRNPDPEVPGDLNGGQALDIRQAVAAFTRHPAAAMGLQDTVGMLRTGLSADFIVLDRNIFEEDPSTIHATQVLQTYFEGRVVHDAAAEHAPV
ncbi:amidohydrolase [Arthrobacter jiangjiafuii]|uniref:Amidohydrolase n=1 Tax=Arthrobacter jiangjiafuii TaxID=2817475 RepID=A0A975M7V2_9MICC|nr:amidohydrolase [Arthrobacter jiangjiafuii]MBP3042981.1 amidohydrolase [Arthrobacter jiangjiafuii]QWC11502.1 amidohydrolase [Arthrobacter jiangjiafuii]